MPVAVAGAGAEWLVPPIAIMAVIIANATSGNINLRATRRWLFVIFIAKNTNADRRADQVFGRWTAAGRAGVGAVVAGLTGYASDHHADLSIPSRSAVARRLLARVDVMADNDDPAGVGFSEIEEAFFRAGDAASDASPGAPGETWSDLEDSPAPSRSLWSRLFTRSRRPATEPPPPPSRQRPASEPRGDDEWDWQIAIARARHSTSPGV